MKVLLVMRDTYASHRDHIRSLLDQGHEIHLATDHPPAMDDPRFVSIVLLTGLNEADGIEHLSAYAAKAGIAFAVTFWEADIVTASSVNQALGHRWASPDADRICRDKRSQRDLLAAHGLPSVKYGSVRRSDAVPPTIAEGSTYVIKPTRLAASIGVRRVDNEVELAEALRDITRMNEQAWLRNFVDGQGDEFAIIEEYLPGREVTVDGVVVGGRFYLGGIMNKQHMSGPYFEEDYYTLPNRFPEEEAEVVGIVQGVVDALGVTHSMFNMELRQDAAGRFRVIEFSTRMSGGQNYGNIRLAHGIDIVRSYCRAVTLPTGRVFDGEPDRHPGRMATCIKFAYRSGKVLRNTAGDVAHSPNFVDYIASAPVGKVLHGPPVGWYEIAGSLAVAAPYRSVNDIDRVERIAAGLDRRLNVLTVAVTEVEPAA